MALESTLSLPSTIVSLSDIGRLLRELETIDEELLQLSLRESGTAVKMPKTTRLMDQLVELNKPNLLNKADRQWLQQQLQNIKQQAPVLHISFSSDPSVTFVEKLINWLRPEIHPLILLSIGLQPNIGGGCIVRGLNRQFDLSLRQDFIDKRQLLISKLALPAAPPPGGTQQPTATNQSAGQLPSLSNPPPTAEETSA